MDSEREKREHEIYLRAYRVLMGLGETRSAVAETLKNAGTRGLVGDSRNCPIHHALRPHFSGDEVFYIEAGVHQISIHLYEYERTGWSSSHIVARFQPPRQVREFMRAFDNGEYPELEEEHHD